MSQELKLVPQAKMFFSTTARTHYYKLRHVCAKKLIKVSYLPAGVVLTVFTESADQFYLDGIQLPAVKIENHQNGTGTRNDNHWRYILVRDLPDKYRQALIALVINNE